MVRLASTDATAATGAANGASGATVTFISLSRSTVGGLEMNALAPTSVFLSAAVVGFSSADMAVFFMYAIFYGQIY